MHIHYALKLKTMIINFTSIALLLPFKDFDWNSPNQKRFHRLYNNGFLALSILVISITAMAKLPHSFQDIGDLILVEAIVYVGMCALGVVVQILQTFDIANQPPTVKKKALSKKKSDIRISGQTIEIIDSIIARFFPNKKLKTADGGAILKALKRKDMLKDLTQQVFAELFYDKYKLYFIKSINPISMTTSQNIDEDLVNSIVSFIDNTNQKTIIGEKVTLF